jgi:glucokinase
VAVNDVTRVTAERHEVCRVELKVRLKVKRLNVVDLEGVSLAARLASRVSLEVGGANLRPLRRPRHASGDDTGIGLAK